MTRIIRALRQLPQILCCEISSELDRRRHDFPLCPNNQGEHDLAAVGNPSRESGSQGLGMRARFRRAIRAPFSHRIEAGGGVIRIIGQKDALEQAVAHEGVITPGVRGLVRNWRAVFGRS